MTRQFHESAAQAHGPTSPSRDEEAAVGQFAVVQGSYRANCLEITGVTAKTISAVDRSWSSRTLRISRSKLVFVGSETNAKRLCQQLQSSQAQLNQERSSAGVRRLERDKKLIEAAKAEARS
jgi:uncharacterized protein YkwD